MVTILIIFISSVEKTKNNNEKAEKETKKAWLLCEQFFSSSLFCWAFIIKKNNANEKNKIKINN